MRASAANRAPSPNTDPIRHSSCSPCALTRALYNGAHYYFTAQPQSYSELFITYRGLEIFFKAMLSGGCINYLILTNKGIPLTWTIACGAITAATLLFDRGTDAIINKSMYNKAKIKPSGPVQLFIHLSLGILVYDLISPWVSVMHFVADGATGFTNLKAPLSGLPPALTYPLLLTCFSVAAQFKRYRWDNLAYGWVQFKKNLFKSPCCPRELGQHQPLANAAESKDVSLEARPPVANNTLSGWEYFLFLYTTLGNTIAYGIFNFFLGHTTVSQAYSYNYQVLSHNKTETGLSANAANTMNLTAGTLFFGIGIIVSLANSSLMGKAFSPKQRQRIRQYMAKHKAYSAAAIVLNVLDSFVKTLITTLLAVSLPFFSSPISVGAILLAIFCDTAQVPPYFIYNILKCFPDFTAVGSDISRVVDAAITVPDEGNGHRFWSPQRLDQLQEFAIENRSDEKKQPMVRYHYRLTAAAMRKIHEMAAQAGTPIYSKV